MLVVLAGHLKQQNVQLAPARPPFRQQIRPLSLSSQERQNNEEKWPPRRQRVAQQVSCSINLTSFSLLSVLS